MKIARNVAVSGRLGKWHPPFVGAMKIARNVAVSGRHDEWHSPFPAPSLRELSSECETEGVYPDERKRSKISEPIKTVRKPSARWNHRTTLPQSRIRSTAPSEREPGRGCAIHPTARKAEGFGRFSSPLRKLKSFYISPFIGGHSLREGAGKKQLTNGGRQV